MECTNLYYVLHVVRFVVYVQYAGVILMKRSFIYVSWYEMRWRVGISIAFAWFLVEVSMKINVNNGFITIRVT